jgi:hypothetical protein
MDPSVNELNYLKIITFNKSPSRGIQAPGSHHHVHAAAIALPCKATYERTRH